MDTLTLINRAHQGDKLARDKILIENTGLIWSIVRRFLNRGHEGEDLFQIGCIGMLKAIDRFDTEFDVAFSLTIYVIPPQQLFSFNSFNFGPSGINCLTVFSFIRSYFYIIFFLAFKLFNSRF